MYVDIDAVDNRRQRVVAPKLVSNGEAPSRARHEIRDGDVIFSLVRPYLKNIAIVPPELDRQIASSAYCVLRPSDELTSAYLFHFLSTDTFIASVPTYGHSPPAGRDDELLDMPIPLPPVEEQRQIVREIERHLTRLDAAKATLERSLQLLRAYRASVLGAASSARLAVSQAAVDSGAVDTPSATPRYGTPRRRAGRLWGSGSVPALTDEEARALPQGWSWLKVRDLGPDPADTVQVGPMSMRSRDFTPDGVPVLNVGCIRWGAIDDSKANHLPSALAQGFGRYHIRAGDIMFTRSGTVGRCAVAQPRHDGWLMTFHLLRIRVDSERCAPEFLRFVLEGAPHIRRQTREASIGTTRAGFNTNLLADLDIPVPPIRVQRAIVAEGERLLSMSEELSSSVAAALSRLAGVRMSVLTQAFAGRLSVEGATAA